MPSIAHLILGFGLGLCLYYLSNGKFSKNHVFILCLNNYLGPDVGWALGIGSFTHALVGYFFFAFILAIFYHYLTRFTFSFESIKKIEIIDLERPKLSYVNTYFLVLAGGVMHVYLDGAMNSAGVFYLVPALGANEGVSWSLIDFIYFWREGALNFNPVLALSIGIVLILGFIYVSTWFIHTYTKRSGFIVILYVVIFMILYYFAGSKTSAHAEGGAILYISIFWLTPLLLCAISTIPIGIKRKKEKTIKEKKECSEENLGIFAIKLAYITIGIVMVAGGAFALIIKNILLNLFSGDTLNMSYSKEIYAAIDIASLILIGIGALIIILGRLLIKSSDHHKNLLIISMWLFISGTIGIIASISGILLRSYIVEYIFSGYGEDITGYINPEGALILVVLLALVILALSIVNIVLAIGLSTKNRKLWRLAILYHLGLAWTIVGLTIACALSENPVKRLFKPREFEKL